MWVHRDLDSLPGFKNAVLTIGAFDGVHLGHREVIRQLREEAAKCRGESVIVTFEPHPRLVLNGSRAEIHLLTTLEEKIFLLEKEGVDHLVVVPFTRAFSELPARDYVSGFLVDKFSPHTIILGYDHHFGHNREGNIATLRKMASGYGFEVLEIPPRLVHHITVSSTDIRKCLERGEIARANELAGYPYLLNGKVIHGDKRGRELGFPTANLSLPASHKLIPARGVYAARATVPSPVLGTPDRGRTFDSAVNIGFRPTFDGGELRIEAYILDFDEDLYGRSVMLSFYAYIRPDIRFSSADALVARMKDDVTAVRAFFNGSSS